ncbi:ABC transporter permease [candidate division KSB1 bacterium]|nr:ABC transporter permease [bacterium]NUM68214.1 ABC transporter permease [candidate division KSB1 bacterium]
MFKNYLKIAFRNLRKHKGYSFLNIAGLAIGMTCCALIMLYVQHEASYDRFHQHAQRLYRVALDAGIGGRFIKSATTSAPMAATLVQELPEVENAGRFWPAHRVLVSYGEKRVYEDHLIYADASILGMFSFPLVQGDPQTALAEPNSIVITEAMVEKYFGSEAPLGKVLRYDNRADYKVTGVLQNLPTNSHLCFDMLVALNTRPESQNPRWISNSYHTYVLLREGTSPAQLEAKFPSLVKKYVAPQIEAVLGQSYDQAIAAGAKWGYFLEAVPDIYLHSRVENQIGATSDINYLYILTAIALFILLIAGINFMNLATARSANRAKEVGMRKVLGSVRTQLVKQFLSESVLLAFLALFIALLLIELLLPAFNRLADKELTLHFSTNLGFASGLAGVALVTGVLAGLYPAVVLSSFQPIAVLKGSLKAGAKSPWLRSTLVVLQFAISIVLLVGTGVVFQQLEYMRNKRLGFNKEQVVVLPIETATGLRNYEAFREQLLQNPNFINVAAASGVPGRIEDDTAHRLEGAPEEVAYPLQIFRGSVDLLSTLEIAVAAGRGFSREFVSDTSEACLLNETAARLMGMTPQSALGKKLTQIGPTPAQSEVRTIIGVVKDFHFESLHREIKPLVMSIAPREFVNVVARLRPENIPATIAFLQEKWPAFEPGYPFRYFFLDEDFGRLFRNEEQQSKIFGSFTILAVLIACLGLFGLASFIAEQRTKEIGVRKVLGASVQQVILLLSKDFTRLVAVAFVIATPVAYVAMNKWLQDFAYRTTLSPAIFVLAGALALVIAWLTVSYQAVKAALTNPVEALRYE